MGTPWNFFPNQTPTRSFRERQPARTSRIAEPARMARGTQAAVSSWKVTCVASAGAAASAFGTSARVSTGAAAQQAHGLGSPGEQRVIGEQADGLVGSCADCGGLGHRRDLGGQRDGGGRLVQTQLLGVVPPPSPEGAVSQDHGGVAGAQR